VIDGVEYEIGTEAVIVLSRAPLTVVSSAVAGGGLGAARAIVNLHVAKNFRPPSPSGHEDWEAPLAEFVRRRGLPFPYVGLLTSAWTEHAEVAEDVGQGVAALALVTVGLGNPVATGLAPPSTPVQSTASAAIPALTRRAVPSRPSTAIVSSVSEAAASSVSGAAPSSASGVVPSTINTIVVVDAAPVPAAMINCVISVTEVKTAALMAAGVVCADGRPASGTSTDAVVVAATGHGPPCRFGGPVSALGSVVARATRQALESGIRRWLERHR
jgi:adenosylcobinamide hydrolase